jgi:hypothetical protein
LLVKIIVHHIDYFILVKIYFDYLSNRKISAQKLRIKFRRNPDRLGGVPGEAGALPPKVKAELTRLWQGLQKYAFTPSSRFVTSRRAFSNPLS